MKNTFLLYILIALSIFALVCSVKKHTSTKSKNKIKEKITQKIQKKLTPKGLQLLNIYGSNSFSNPYGPRPELIMRDAYIKNNDGSVARKRVRLIRGLQSQVIQDSCDITSKENYYFCLTISNCDLCSASDVCGWCELTKQCLPGNQKEMSCPGACINAWYFNKQSCDGIVKSGHLSNFDPIGTEKLNTVEYTYPKVRVDSIVHTPEVVTTPVLLGTIQQHHQRQKRDILKDNKIVQEQVVDVNQPVYGEVRRYLDARTGVRVDNMGNHDIRFHGTDDVNVQSDSEDDYDPAENRRLWHHNQQQLV